MDPNDVDATALALTLVELAKGRPVEEFGLLAPLHVVLLLPAGQGFDETQLEAAVSAEFGDATRLPLGTAGEIAFGFPTSPPSSCRFGRTQISAKELETALSQAFWEGAAEIARSYKSAIGIWDSAGGARVERVRRFQRLVRAALRSIDAVAIYWPASARLIVPTEYTGAPVPESLMFGPVNVRMFRSNTQTLIMDTLGLHALDLPDLEVSFDEADPNKIALLLYEYADYMYERGDVLQDGHTVDGVGAHWRCFRGASSLPPARQVIRFDALAPGVNELGEARCPGCKWRVEALSLWECDCGFVWNPFDTEGVCPACGRTHTTTACLKCKAVSPRSLWYVKT